MEHTKNHNHQHDHQHAMHRDAAVRDDRTWTQYLTNLAANKLSQPKTATLKVLEQQLARLNEELGAPDLSRVQNRLGPAGESSTQGAEEQNREREGAQNAPANALSAGLNDTLAVNTDNGMIRGVPSLITGSSDSDSLRFSGSAQIAKVNPQVERFNQELIAGSRWTDVLWQFIIAHQKRVVDLERLGIEPSERMDLQVDIIRQIAATYEKLGLLTRLPDSLHEAHECKKVDDIRTMALVYVARKMMDVSSPEEISDENDDEDSGKKKKRFLDFPRSVISPYEGIRPIEFDPLTVIMAA